MEVTGDFVVITCPPLAPAADVSTQRLRSLGRALLRWHELHVIAPFLFPFAFRIPPGAGAPLHHGFVQSCFGSI